MILVFCKDLKGHYSTAKCLYYPKISTEAAVTVVSAVAFHCTSEAV